MSCPKCGGNDLWDDDSWWGCNRCGMMTTQRNNLSPYDVFNRGKPDEWRGSKYVQPDGRPKQYSRPVRDEDDD